jgi:uncharacterized protein HemX
MIQFAAAGAFLRRIPAWVWVALALLAGGWYYGHTRYEAGQTDVKAEWNKANVIQEAANRAKETVWRKAVYDEAYKAERQRIEHQAQTDRAVDDLRSGALRVRDRLQCKPRPPASGPIPDDDEGKEGGLLREDAEFLLRFAGEADQAVIQLSECQSYVRTILGE